MLTLPYPFIRHRHQLPPDLNRPRAAAFSFILELYVRTIVRTFYFCVTTIGPEFIQIRQNVRISHDTAIIVPAGGPNQSAAMALLLLASTCMYRAPMMQTNFLRGALKRHALGASARLGGSSCTALRIGRSRGCSGRNLSSVVAVRDEDDDDDGAAAAETAAAVAHVRAAVNGAVKKRGPSLVGKSTKERQQTSSPSVEDEEIKKNYLDQIHSDEEEHVSPTHLKYTGGQSMPLTSKLKIVEPGEDAPRGIWPVYRILVRNKEHWIFMLLFLLG